MLIAKNSKGAYLISDFVNGYLLTRTYYGYTKREAVALFKKELPK